MNEALRGKLQNAITKAGGVIEVARLMSQQGDYVYPQLVQSWMAAERIPSDRVIPLEKALGGAITRGEMRPDIYPEN